MHRLGPRICIVSSMILLGAASRLLPHPPNVSPIAAIALFGGAYLCDKRLAFFVPLAAMAVSDAVLGFHSLMLWVFGSFGVSVCIGIWLRKRRRVTTFAAAALLGSVQFYLITNFAVWFSGSLYPRTVEGLIACYIAALPFFQNTLLGDAMYTAVLFGSFALAQKRFPALRELPLTGSSGHRGLHHA